MIKMPSSPPALKVKQKKTDKQKAVEMVQFNVFELDDLNDQIVAARNRVDALYSRWYHYKKTNNEYVQTHQGKEFYEELKTLSESYEKGLFEPMKKRKGNFSN